MKYTYKTQGTCSTQIIFDLSDGEVHDVHFINGCDGNLKAIGRLVEGMKAEDVIDRCGGVSCGNKSTSCGDQLATALKLAMEQEEKNNAGQDA